MAWQTHDGCMAARGGWQPFTLWKKTPAADVRTSRFVDDALLPSTNRKTARINEMSSTPMIGSVVI